MGFLIHLYTMLSNMNLSAFYAGNFVDVHNIRTVHFDKYPLRQLFLNMIHTGRKYQGVLFRYDMAIGAVGFQVEDIGIGQFFVSLVIRSYQNKPF